MRDDAPTPDPADPKPWTHEGGGAVYDVGFARVRAETYRTPAGVIVEPYVIFDSGDWAATVALTTAGEVVTVRLYRPPVEAVVEELPAGRLDPADASPAHGAARETAEETGYRGEPAALVRRGALHPYAARQSARAYGFLAFDAEPGVARAEVDEDIRVMTRPFAWLYTRWCRLAEGDLRPTPGAAHAAFLNAAALHILSETDGRRAALRDAVSAAVRGPG